MKSWQAPLRLVLGGVLFTITFSASLTLLYVSYTQFYEQSLADLQDTFESQNSLFSLVLETELNVVENELEQTAILIPPLDPKQPLELFSRQLEQLRRDGTIGYIDILLLEADNGRTCLNLGGFTVKSQTDCSQLVSSYQAGSLGWSLYHFTDAEYGLMSKKPLIHPDTGRVWGYLYGGVSLSNNLQLMTRTLSASNPLVLDIGLSYNGMLINSTRSNFDLTAKALARIASETVTTNTNEFYFSDDVVSRGRTARIFNTQVPALGFQVALDANSLDKLEASLIRNLVGALIFNLTFTAFAVLFVGQITTQPLRRMLQLTSSPSKGLTPPYKGFITEFNDLSTLIDRQVAQLVQSKERIELDKEQLEQSHSELAAAIAKNKSLLHRFYDLQEDERKQLAQELHDDLGQLMTVVRTDAYLISKSLPSEHPAAANAASITEAVKHMYDVVYTRMMALRPYILKEMGLAAAIREMAIIKTFHSLGVNVHLPSGQADSIRFDDSVEIALYRIVQESLTNVAKHARADSVSIAIDVKDEFWCLRISDDGRGLPSNSDALGYGITGMKERAAGIDAELSIRSENGVTIELQLSMKHAV